ncbi:hypothetical protein B0H67DRAFT_201532 [Lasiosphaeris hirsuta]|uniref:Uncharacterized protein n=1 Tax=Lasiosphaeris hirsuta TaxID=260670 RepID=A0AA40DYV2_9PEZI|nr:hypothetical protein B0H67DRAFT_201532 [Lasiosphaeris hirsuta]
MLQGCCVVLLKYVLQICKGWKQENKLPYQKRITHWYRTTTMDSHVILNLNSKFGLVSEKETCVDSEIGLIVYSREILRYLETRFSCAVLATHDCGTGHRFRAGHCPTRKPSRELVVLPWPLAFGGSLAASQPLQLISGEKETYGPGGPGAPTGREGFPRGGVEGWRGSPYSVACSFSWDCFVSCFPPSARAVVASRVLGIPALQLEPTDRLPGQLGKTCARQCEDKNGTL